MPPKGLGWVSLGFDSIFPVTSQFYVKSEGKMAILVLYFLCNGSLVTLDSAKELCSRSPETKPPKNPSLKPSE